MKLSTADGFHIVFAQCGEVTDESPVRWRVPPSGRLWRPRGAPREGVG
ncbi:hypothetical protein BN903_2 [Halorubrum sp. AJ67]|nr:hypothetical protein BN903_2 [Halorubrum sp. AJ67]